VPGTTTGDAAKGQALFTNTCAACHQATGEGLAGVFPPLKGNAAVNDPDPTRHIHTILHGLQGSNVDGISYPAPMPPFGTTLSDADIAAIINYERSSWGNHGAPVTSDHVATERAKSN
jgi:mono/diheme cytochrome c family protein